MNTSFFKKKIEYSFDKYADKYDSRTILQKEIMFTLLNFLYQVLEIIFWKLKINKKKLFPVINNELYKLHFLKKF